MTQISRKLEKIVKKTLSTTIVPVGTEQGIQVGHILITSNYNLKNIYKKQVLLYENIHLNAVAIKLANILAVGYKSIATDRLYLQDQEYGRYYNDSQILRSQYEKAIISNQHDKSDILWAKYVESRARTQHSKKIIDGLI
jgi:hypothetical protein